MGDVERYWGLRFDPFRGGPAPDRFVPTPTHARALSRLHAAVESGGRPIRLEGPPGSGKTAVLGRWLADLRSPGRRVARSSGAGDGPSVLAELSAGLGARVPAGSPWSVGWKALTDAVRLARLQGLSVVLAIDDAEACDDPRALDRLTHLDPHPRARVTVLRVFRTDEDEAVSAPSRDDAWGPPIRLVALTRTEAGRYLAAKLDSAGRTSPTFLPRAVTRLHALALGLPRGLDRLASEALAECARRSRPVVGPETVDQLADESVA